MSAMHLLIGWRHAEVILATVLDTPILWSDA